MKLAGMVRTTLLDFPGQLACVLFTAGCPYNCFYCHNRIALTGDAACVSVTSAKANDVFVSPVASDTISASVGQTKANNVPGVHVVSAAAGDSVVPFKTSDIPGVPDALVDSVAAGIPVGQAMEFLQKRRGLLEGVVVSGGEPTIHQDLDEFINRIKNLGYVVKLDTCGCNPQVIARLMEQGAVDYIALDVKAPWNRYREICGDRAEPEAVRETLSILEKSVIHWEVRTTVAPTLNFEDLQEIAHQMPRVPAWRLNLYRIPEIYRPEDAWRVNAPAPSLADLQRWATRLSLLQPNLLRPE